MLGDNHALASRLQHILLSSAQQMQARRRQLTSNTSDPKDLAANAVN